MKKIFSVVTASIFVAGLMGLTPALASENNASQTELVLSEAGSDWSLALQDTTNGSETVISDALRGDRGTIVNSDATEANYVKYQGLGVDDGLATAVLVSGETLDLAWSPADEDSEVSVVVNGAPVSIDQTQSSTSVEVPLGVTVDVSVQAISADPSPVTGLYTSEFAQLSVSTPSSSSPLANSMAALAIALPAKSTLRQNAFIPDSSLIMFPNGICTPFGVDTYRFLGDNRGFSPNDGASFRTRMDVGIVWAATPTVTFTKLVGTTIRERQVNLFPETWIEDARLTASSSTMSYTYLSSNSSYVRFQTSQDVVNPFCNVHETNGITSTTTISIYRSGAVSGVISYLAMPNHEIYLRQDTNPYTVIGQFNLQSQYCLIKQLADPFCSQSVTLRN